MKKTYHIFTMTVLVCCMMACGNNSTTDNSNLDNLETIELKKIDDAATMPQNEFKSNVTSEGFGRCLKSGCNCKSFEGRGETCRNCGHSYKKHY